jgi:DNA end-binding protein Ku
MPRAIWSGAISFGLINIPIKLYTAVSRKTVSFNQIDSRTGSRIKHLKVSAADGEPVPQEAIVKGYQLASGEYVLIGDDEMATLDPEATRTIDIEQFVDLDEIDPLFYDSAYYAMADPAARKPYALLTQAMEEQGKVAIARFVMRSKQHLCAIRPADDKLLISTMVYPDEVVDPAELEEGEGAEGATVSDRELAMARQLVASLSEEFEPERFEDTHREQVMELIERKASGEESISTPAPVSEQRVVDLMDALEASVQAAKEARTSHPAARGPEEAEKSKKARKSAASGKAKKAAKPSPERKSA